MMKNIIYLVLSCFLLASFPATTYAKKKIYVESNTTMDSQGPRRGPVYEWVTIGSVEDDCELQIIINDTIANVRMSLTRNGITYIDEEASATPGQVFNYDLSEYELGDYVLSVEVEGTVVSLFTVTIEE